MLTWPEAGHHSETHQIKPTGNRFPSNGNFQKCYTIAIKKNSIKDFPNEILMRILDTEYVFPNTF